MRSPRHAACSTGGRFDSPLLANRLGDPTEREVLVHIPPEGVEAMAEGASSSALSSTLHRSLPQALLAPVGRRLEKQSLSAMNGWFCKVKMGPAILGHARYIHQS